MDGIDPHDGSAAHDELPVEPVPIEPPPAVVTVMIIVIVVVVVDVGGATIEGPLDAPADAMPAALPAAQLNAASSVPEFITEQVSPATGELVTD
jgi:hypothetical protein